MTLTFGLAYSYSDFFIPLETTFGWSHAVDSSVASISLLVFSVGSLLGGQLASRVGFRRLCYAGALLVGFGTMASSQISGFWELVALFGIVTSLGTAFVVVIASGLVVKWFVRRRGFAVGIMAAGSGFGTLVVPQVAQVLISWRDWRTSFLFLGVGFLGLLLAASYFMRAPEELSIKPYGWHSMTEEQRQSSGHYTIKEAMSTLRFWMVYSMFFLGSFSAAMFIVHVVPFARTFGINETTGSIALGIFGAGSLISRLTVGVISDRVSRTLLIVISFLSEASAMVALPFVASNALLLMACAFGIGFGYGGFISDFLALTGDLFGSRWTYKIWSVDETAYGIGGLIGPIFAGAYFDAFGTYAGAFETGAALALFGLFLSIIFPRTLKAHQTI